MGTGGFVGAETGGVVGIGLASWVGGGALGPTCTGGSGAAIGPGRATAGEAAGGAIGRMRAEEERCLFVGPTSAGASRS